ncbi:hypothetical protein GCM10007301_35830 [Azorhizobium oxalatiphilum]|uniref:DUF4089 domain-containing protein n=1 Tax=Azorhizobium oxalatiphilum TaxID=980631 RepID=A0A917C6T0_9HYPH|nr:DUF4089 domain-containing protein [Azorhizobium oxalatiphilum]GGF72852.1 hypothetical protein GCM10007301_35830 [Azorhizobium oxalatiphilum]
MSDFTPPPRLADEAVSDLLDAGIVAFSIPAEEAWRKEAFSYLRTIADAAQFVLSADLGDEAEPAAVFRP